MRGEKHSSSSINHNKALILLEKGEFVDALDILEKLDETPATLNDRAAALHLMGRTEEAIILLDKALKRDAGYVPAVLNRRYMGRALDAALKPPQLKIFEEWGAPPDPPPKISVIIPTYNRPEYLHESVHSVLDQTYKDFEIIVVNDGGSAIAKDILQNLNSPRIRYLMIEHAGPSAAKNAGLSRAGGELVAYLDDDDLYYPDHLETLASFFDQNTDAQIAYTQWLRCVQELKDNRWETVEKKTSPSEPFEKSKLIESNFLATSCIMHRRKLIEEVGAFNEALAATEDWEWYLRVAEKYPFYFIDRLTIEVRVRKNIDAQLTSKPAMMRSNNVTVRYMHRLIALLSKAPDRFGYHRTLRQLTNLFTKWPDLITMLDVNELATRKPYACLFRLGKDLAQIGETARARRVFFMAFLAAPHEPKMYWKLIRP